MLIPAKKLADILLGFGSSLLASISASAVHHQDRYRRLFNIFVLLSPKLFLPFPFVTSDSLLAEARSDALHSIRMARTAVAVMPRSS